MLFLPASQDEPDPFYDLEQHALLGVANIYVEALHHDVRHEYDAPIIAPTGKVRAEHVCESKGTC